MNNRDAYNEILTVLSKHGELIEKDYKIDIRGYLNARLRSIDISEMFSINVSTDSGSDWYRLSDFQTISMYGSELNRTISWSDDGSQPENEWLYSVNFCTGAYIFGGDYPIETFNNFFNELKSYSPKYIDSANKSLYFTKENAKAVHDDFDGLFRKYKGLVGVEQKAKRIIEIEEELKKLQDD